MAQPIQTSSELPSNSSTSIPNPVTDSEVPTSGIAKDEVVNGGASKEKSEAEEAADRLYEERIEEEYAKREGGA